MLFRLSAVQPAPDGATQSVVDTFRGESGEDLAEPPGIRDILVPRRSTPRTDGGLALAPRRRDRGTQRQLDSLRVVLVSGRNNLLAGAVDEEDAPHLGPVVRHRLAMTRPGESRRFFLQTAGQARDL